MQNQEKKRYTLVLLGDESEKEPRDEWIGLL